MLSWISSMTPSFKFQLTTFSKVRGGEFIENFIRITVEWADVVQTLSIVTLLSHAHINQYIFFRGSCRKHFKADKTPTFHLRIGRGHEVIWRIRESEREGGRSWVTCIALADQEILVRIHGKCDVIVFPVWGDSIDFVWVSDLFGAQCLELLVQLEVAVAALEKQVEGLWQFEVNFCFEVSNFLCIAWLGGLDELVGGWRLGLEPVGQVLDALLNLFFGNFVASRIALFSYNCFCFFLLHANDSISERLYLLRPADPQRSTWMQWKRMTKDFFFLWLRMYF